MTQRYNPPTKVTATEISWQAVVSRADPERARFVHNEIEYEFENRVFRGDPDKRGAYGD